MKEQLKKFATQGEVIYRRLKPKLLSQAKNKFAAIDVETEDFFLGNSLIEAFQKAKKERPSHKFHFVRIGHQACVSFKHRTNP